MKSPGGVDLARERLRVRGLELPPLQIGRGNFVGAVRSGSMLFVSGQGSDNCKGKVGKDVSVDDAYLAARECALRLLAVVEATTGSLDDVVQIVKLVGFVNAIEGFTKTPAVIDGASDLLVELYGEAGRHARAAIGVVALPSDFAVEIDMVVELR